VFNTSYVFTHLASSSFFFFALTGTSRLIWCSKPVTCSLLPKIINTCIYNLCSYLLSLHRPDRNQQVNSLLNTSCVFTHLSSSSFFFFTLTGTTRLIRFSKPLPILLLPSSLILHRIHRNHQVNKVLKKIS